MQMCYTLNDHFICDLFLLLLFFLLLLLLIPLLLAEEEIRDIHYKWGKSIQTEVKLQMGM